MGEVMQVDAGETGKASASATNARGRARAGTDNCSSPRNLDKKFKLLLRLPEFWKGELVIEKEVQEDSCLVSLDLPSTFSFFQGFSSLFIITVSTVSRRDREIGLKYSDAQ